jgi:hypothetical protein
MVMGEWLWVIDKKVYLKFFKNIENNYKSTSGSQKTFSKSTI